MARKPSPRREQEIDANLEKNRSERRRILDDVVGDRPHPHTERDTPLERVIHGQNVDIERIKKKRRGIE